MRRVYHRPRPDNQKKRFLVNQQIKYPLVSLVNAAGESLGAVATSRALALAEEVGLDLVEVNPKANPPVVKIMDYGQFKYKKEKESQRQKVKQKKVDLKGIRISVRISQHDFAFRLDQAKKFLAKGHKLKLELILKGRERQHPRKADEVINKFIDMLRQDQSLNIEVESGLTKQGGRFSIILINKQ